MVIASRSVLGGLTRFSPAILWCERAHRRNLLRQYHACEGRLEPPRRGFLVRLPSSHRLRTSSCPPVVTTTSSSVAGRGVGHHQRFAALPFASSAAARDNESSESGPVPPEDDDADDPDAYSPTRHTGIVMHPESISRRILPGNFVKWTNPRTGVRRLRYTEIEHGYFWMIRDLRRTDEKPVLSNEEIIPEAEAKVFPALPNLTKLDSSEKVGIPSYFLRKNRSHDAAAQCTVVAVAFRDFGYQLLKTWLDPVAAEVAAGGATPGLPVPSPHRVEIVRLSINEGWVNSWVLRGLIRTLARRNTPADEQGQTLMYFGKDLEPFRDSLRMHNLMTGYVFLLDGLGRVRFAGSGRASEDEVHRLLRFASDLTRQPRSSPAKSRRGKQR